MSWSLSSLKTFEQCGFKYKLKYIDKVEEQRSFQATRGIDKHKIIEDFVSSKIETLPSDLDYYTQFLTGLRQHEIYPEHKVALNRQWEPVPWGSQEVWYKGVLDLKLLIRGEYREIRGSDLCVDQEQPILGVIYDWKSGKIYPDHDDQKSIYSLSTLAEHPTLRSVRAIHVYFDLGQNREKELHRDQMHSVRESWENRVVKLETAGDESLIPNPGFHCRWCSFSRAKGGPCRF